MSSSQVNLQSKKQLSNSSPNLNFSSLVEVKLDVSVIQTALCQTLSEMNNRITSLQKQANKFQKEACQKLSFLDNRLDEQNQRSNFIQEFTDQHQKKIKQHEDKFDALTLDQGFLQEMRRKFAEFQANRKQGGVSHFKQSKDVELNTVTRQNLEIKPKNSTTCGQNNIENDIKIYSGPIERASEKDFSNYSDDLEKKFEQKLERLQRSIHQQLQQVKLNLGNMIMDQATKGAFSTKNILNSKSRISLKQDFTKKDDEVKQGTHRSTNNTEINLAISSIEDKLEEMSEQIDKKFNIFLQVNVQQIKNQFFNKMRQLTDVLSGKMEETTKTNSVMANTLLEFKTKIANLTAKQDESSKFFSDKITGLDNQIAFLKEASKFSKQNFENLCEKLGKLEFITQKNQNGTLETSQDRITSQNLRMHTNDSEENQQKRSSKQIIPNQNARNSNIGGRTSILGNNLNALNINGESLEDMLRKINQKLINLTDRFNRYEDEKKSLANSSGKSKQGFLPRIQGKGSNAPSFDIVKIELKKINDELIKTNERLQTTKGRLSELYDAHNLLPLQIEDLYKKLQEHSQFQEDRLLQLIKELINRCLTDPFNNNFTNTLKREINVKFLEIKHEYYGILKEIETKVEDRAQVRQLQKIKDRNEQGLLQVKSIIHKKCDNDDFKKGFKYLENKLKEVYTFVKAESQINQQKNQNKVYVNLKKQY